MAPQMSRRLSGDPSAGRLARLEAGRLVGFRLGSEWRVTEDALLEFMGFKSTTKPKEGAPMTTLAAHVASQSRALIAKRSCAGHSGVARGLFSSPGPNGPKSSRRVSKQRCGSGGGSTAGVLASATGRRPAMISGGARLSSWASHQASPPWLSSPVRILRLSPQAAGWSASSNCGVGSSTSDPACRPRRNTWDFRS